jgi:ParB family chromosome partitioning protein
LKSSAKNIKLTSYDEIFQNEETRSDDQREKVQQIPLSEITDFPEHPFQVKEDEALMEMAESIKKYGVLAPALVRPKPGGGYEMVSGHRRKRASELASVETIPCIVREMDRDTAIIAMVDANLQRESILPSEKALAYKMKLEAINRQMGRPLKENVGQVVPTFSGKRSTEIVGEQAGESYKQVQRYIRLTELSPELRQMVDDKKIAFNPAVELSYLKSEEQASLLDEITKQEATPSLSQAQRLKKYSQDGKLDVNVMDAIMTEEKKGFEKLTLPGDRLQKYFPKTYTTKQIEDTIFKLLEQWQRKRQQEQER